MTIASSSRVVDMTTTRDVMKLSALPNERKPSVQLTIDPVVHHEINTGLLRPMSTSRSNLVIFQVSFINLLTSMTNGFIVVGLPRIAMDLNLPDRLYLWPTSVFGLTAGSTLLLSGAVADVAGAKLVELVGCSLLGVFTLAMGLSSTGIQLVMFRALQGVASAMHVPCSVALVTRSVPSGNRRNIGFACLGLTMALGFSVGLVCGGILVDTAGWRVGFYIVGAILLAQTTLGWRILPPDTRAPKVFMRLRRDVDWIGALIACVGLALFSYVLAVVSADGNEGLQASTIAMLILSLGLIAAFPVWIQRQEKKSKPALIPNSLWKSLKFSSICVLMVLSWGVNNGMELFSSL